MPIAFVLINCDLGGEDELTKELRTMKEVKEVHSVYGVYDIITKVEADSSEKLKEVITQKIRRLNKVRSTLTMMVVT